MEDKRLNLTRIYNDILNKLEVLVSDYKISPSEVLSYVKNNTNELIEEFGYSDVSDAGRILTDVALHLSNADQDKVMTFECFRAVRGYRV